MKKLVLLFSLALFVISAMGQDYGVNYTVASPAIKAQFLIPKNSTIKVTSTHIDYSVLRDIPAGTLFSTAIADVTWVYPVGYTSVSTGTITTLTSTTANITTANVATTLTLPGGTTITKTTGNANSATTSGSLVVGGNDTLTTTHIAATNAALSGTLGVTGVATFTAAPVLTAGIDVNTTDTITAATVGTICYKTSDSTLYLKVRATGTTGARWKVLTNAR